MATETNETPKKSKPKRLNKEINVEKGVVFIEVIGGTKGKMTFDPKKLTDPKVQSYLPLLALNHRLGDAAAGRQGIEAEKAIEAVWAGLVKGELTVRAPAQPKVAVNDIMANLAKLSPAEKKTASALLKSLGFDIPV